MALPRWSALLAAAACGAGGQTIASWGSSRGSFAAALGVFAAGGWLLARLDKGRGGFPGPAHLQPGATGDTPSPVAADQPAGRPGRRAVALSLLGLGLLLGGVAAVHVDESFSAVQLAGYILSLVFLLGFAVLTDREPRRAHHGPPTSEGRRSRVLRTRGWGVEAPSYTPADLAVLAGLTALALFFRLWQLGRIPALVWDDELLYLLDALNLIEGPLLSPFASGSWGAPYLHAYSIAAAATLVADRALALRLVSAIPGALSVPLLYLAMRELFDRRFAFFAALLMAVSAWHTILSREGYVWAINGFAEVLVLWFLARGLKRGRLEDFALSGFGLGLGVVYTYAAALMPAVLTLFAVFLLLSAPDLLRARWRGLLYLALCATVVVAPRVAALAANPDMRGYQLGALVLHQRGEGEEGEQRSEAEQHEEQEEVETPLAVVARQLEQIAQSFNRRADNNELFVPAPNEPLLDPVTAAAFGLGFFWALFSLPRIGPALLLLTFALMLLPPALGLSSTEWATAWRACGVVPGLFGLAGAPLAIALEAPRSRRGRLLTAALVAPLLALVVFINAHAYFVRHPTKERWSSGRNAGHTQAAQRILAAAPGSRILVNHDVAFSHVRALASGKRDYEVFTWPDDDVLPDLFDEEPRATLILSAAQLYWEDDIGAGAVLVDLLQHYYPGGRREDVTGSDGRTLLVSYELSAEQIRVAHGLSSEGEGRFSGTLVVPADGTYRLQLRRQPERETAGERASAPPGNSARAAPSRTPPRQRAGIELEGKPFARAFLAKGVYAVAVHTAGDAVPELMWSRDEEPFETVPTSRLLRRPLPAWGFRETVWRDRKMEWQRWVPQVWFTAERLFDTEPAARVEWTGEIRLPHEGSYTLMLMSSAETSMWIDGAPILTRELTWPTWTRLPVDFSSGPHILRLEAGPPVERRDVRLFWIDEDSRPGLFRGVGDPPRSDPGTAAESPP